MSPVTSRHCVAGAARALSYIFLTSLSVCQTYRTPHSMWNVWLFKSQGKVVVQRVIILFKGYHHVNLRRRFSVPLTAWVNLSPEPQSKHKQHTAFSFLKPEHLLVACKQQHNHFNQSLFCFSLRMKYFSKGFLRDCTRHPIDALLFKVNLGTQAVMFLEKWGLFLMH